MTCGTIPRVADESLNFSNMRLIKPMLWLVMAAFFIPAAAFAVPASPVPVKVKQKDGTTLTIRLHGDEFYNYATTLDGRTVVPGPDGIYYYAQLDERGELIPSATRASDRGKALQGLVTGRTIQSPAAISRGEALRNRAAATRRLTAPRPGTRAASAKRVEGAMKTLVLLVNFQDVQMKAENSPAAFTNLLNQKGYSDYGAVGSVRDFYVDNSNGIFQPEFEVKGPYTVSKELKYYGEQTSTSYDARPAEMAKEAIELADADGVDFSQYAQEGEIKNLIILYAGYGQNDSGQTDALWPHESKLSWWKGLSAMTIDGVKVDTYACSSELNAFGERTGIGTICHEFGHVLGYPDFYDTDGASFGASPGLGFFSTMALGSYVDDCRTPVSLTAYERWAAGWIEPVELTEAGNYTLEPLYNGQAYLINTKTDKEYFLLENRNGTNFIWDRFFFGKIPQAAGLLIYHVDQSANNVSGTMASTLWENNAVNAVKDRECMKILPSTGTEDLRNAPENTFFPGKDNVTSFTENTSPALISWSKESTGLSVHDIALGSDGNVTFRVEGTKAVKGEYAAFDGIKGTYAAGETIYLRVKDLQDGVASLTWRVDGKLNNDVDNGIVLPSGEHTVEAVIKDANVQTERLIKYIVVQ